MLILFPLAFGLPATVPLMQIRKHTNTQLHKHKHKNTNKQAQRDPKRAPKAPKGSPRPKTPNESHGGQNAMLVRKTWCIGRHLQKIDTRMQRTRWFHFRKNATRKNCKCPEMPVHGVGPWPLKEIRKLSNHQALGSLPRCLAARLQNMQKSTIHSMYYLSVNESITWLITKHNQTTTIVLICLVS